MNQTILFNINNMDKKEALDKILKQYLKDNVKYKIGDCLGHKYDFRDSDMIVDNITIDIRGENLDIEYYGCKPKNNFHISKRRIFPKNQDDEYVILIKTKEEIEILHNKEQYAKKIKK